MLIDCGTCEVRGLACDDCVVSVLLDGPPTEAADPSGGPSLVPFDVDETERRALLALSDARLVPRLRHSAKKVANLPLARGA